ncbi:PepSY-associated TM helix domain-containing protein [Tahibacter amnicola]|uniref:PepSY domain-containing protein n=1 Tax=Tahibacter amnicola TaxID=2976241 RepID=A0ABY6BHQ1_9GAMM|nr:PepSY-associated TM helix domain-containing protein [Tahibacter amnicola]UXI68600.1 PepSY domain-containing protein [Tahibacter amnicola]
MNGRKVLKWLHLWVGLSAGLVFAMLGLTGAVLLWQPELAQRSVAAYERPAHREAAATLIDRVRRDIPDVSGIELPRADMPVWQVFAKGKRLYLDDEGTVLATRSRDTDLILWLRDLHMHLLAGDAGEAVLGVIGIALLFLLVTGIYLWWPGRGAILGSFRWYSQPPVRRWLTWHRSLGAGVVPLLLLLAVTGTLMVYSGFTRSTLRSLMGDAPEPRPPAPIAVDPQRAIDWNALLAAAQAALPEAELRRITFGRGDNAVVTVRGRQPGEWHPAGRSSVALDPYSAQVLTVQDATRQGAGARAAGAMYPLHTGNAGGLPMRLVLTAVAFAPCFLLVTGFLFWRRRRARG